MEWIIGTLLVLGSGYLGWCIDCCIHNYERISHVLGTGAPDPPMKWPWTREPHERQRGESWDAWKTRRVAEWYCDTPSLPQLPPQTDWLAYEKKIEQRLRVDPWADVSNVSPPTTLESERFWAECCPDCGEPFQSSENATGGATMYRCPEGHSWMSEDRPPENSVPQSSYEWAPETKECRHENTERFLKDQTGGIEYICTDCGERWNSMRGEQPDYWETQQLKTKKSIQRKAELIQKFGLKEATRIVASENDGPCAQCGKPLYGSTFLNAEGALVCGMCKRINDEDARGRATAMRVYGSESRGKTHYLAEGGKEFVLNRHNTDPAVVREAVEQGVLSVNEARELLSLSDTEPHVSDVDA